MLTNVDFGGILCIETANTIYERQVSSVMAVKRMLFVGNTHIRFAVGTPYIPTPGETIRSDANYTFSPGGRSALSAVAAARLGYDAVLCTRVGNDYYGDRLVEVFKKEKLHIANVTVDRENQTGLSLELVEQDGTVRSILFPGANRTLSGLHAENALSCYPDAIIASLESAPETVIRLSEIANERRIPFFLDASADRDAMPEDFPFESLSKTELLILNEADARLFSGIDPVNEEKRKLACYTMCKRFDVKYILLQLGNRGCFLYDGKYFSAISTFDDEPIDTAGASEAFVAALLGEYLRTHDLRTAAEFAGTVYAKTASKHGGFQALPSREEL